MRKVKQDVESEDVDGKAVEAERPAQCWRYLHTASMRFDWLVALGRRGSQSECSDGGRA